MLLPLFPLGTVLYPGMLLPLHIFEERYRQLVRDLLERPEPRQFGVIAIRKGRETGIDGVHSLYPIGCIAALRRVERLEDGRFDLVTVGTERFRLNALDQTLPYLQGEIEPLGADAADQAAAAPLVRAVQAAFRAYLDALTERGGATVQRRGPARRAGAAVLRDRRRHGGRPAGASGPARRARHHPPAGRRACPVVTGNRHAAGNHVAARPGPAVLAVQPELSWPT